MDALSGQGRWWPVVLTALAALPAAALVAWLLVRARVRRGVERAQAVRTAVTEVGMVVGTVPWIWMILTPLPARGLVYLVPFSDLRAQFHHPLVWVLYQIAGNLLVFAAFGLLAPVRWRIHPLWIVLIAALGSATVETLQWALDLGRVASVDDVLVNATGAGLAALCSRPWWRRQLSGLRHATPRQSGPSSASPGPD